MHWKSIFRLPLRALFLILPWQRAVFADSFTPTVFATGGSSTVVRYSTSGAVLNTYTIAGKVDGARRIRVLC